jgi:hypothetical protein
MSRRFSIQFVAIALSGLLSLAMLGSVDRLATSRPPAGLVAQVAHASVHA